jgi:hypothetical protein
VSCSVDKTEGQRPANIKTGMLEKASSPKHQGKRIHKALFDAAKESIDQRRNTAIDLARYELET